jgi:hypothetical protein
MNVANPAITAAASFWTTVYLSPDGGALAALLSAEVAAGSTTAELARIAHAAAIDRHADWRTTDMERPPASKGH